jgi:DNA (cytosine-5)-methyltransferase 1
MITIDLFCGGGGMSLGFQNAGFSIIAAVDNWKPAIEIYRRNFSHPLYEYDLSEPSQCLDALEKFKPEIIIGGPPCQDFSSAGKRDESLGRANLTVAFSKIVADIKPRWFVMENVDRAEKSKTYLRAKQLLQKSGYGLTQTILNASYCGVPQNRKRLFLIGEFGGEPDGLLPIIESAMSTTPMTVKDYLGKLIEIEHYYRHPRSYKRRAIFSVNEPSPTIRGVNRPVPKGYPGHSGDSIELSANIRPLTTKERSLIQTFPEEFEFIGSKADIEQVVGNAVPVKLAQYVAECILAFTNKLHVGTKLLSKNSKQLKMF